MLALIFTLNPSPIAQGRSILCLGFEGITALPVLTSFRSFAGSIPSACEGPFISCGTVPFLDMGIRYRRYSLPILYKAFDLLVSWMVSSRIF